MLPSKKSSMLSDEVVKRMLFLLREIAENDCATQRGSDADMMLEWAVEAREIMCQVDPKLVCDGLDDKLRSEFSYF